MELNVFISFCAWGGEIDKLGQIFKDGFGLDQWNWLVLVTFIVSVLSLWYTMKTVVSVKREAEKDRIDEECQRLLLIDIVRHLYRNKVCTLAMQYKYMQAEGKKYPSDEHFLKLELLPKDLYLEQFYKDPQKFNLLHELEMLLRNYNIEVEVAQRHFFDTYIDEETKMRDFSTLNFKPGYLTVRILEAMDKLWGNKLFEYEGSCFTHREKMVHEIENAHNQNKEKNLVPTNLIELSFFANEEEDGFVTKIFSDKEKFLGMLQMDVSIECGRNKKGEEKIHLIPYERR